MRALVAELLGTFFLVFAGTGAIVIDEVRGGAVSHVGIALTFGLVVLALIYALGEVSGAHFNPAVSFGFWAAGRFPGRRVPAYVLSQCAGALLASGLLRLLFLGDTTSLGATRPAAGTEAWQSLVLEVVLTLFLMFVILSVSTGAKEKGVMAGVAVGAVIALEALFAGPVCGASMNPARSLAPALASLNLSHLWLYLAAPPLGAGLAVLACHLVHEGPCCGPTTEETRAMPATDRPTPKRVLFVCVENSNRSQMAEAFARLHGGGKVEAFSAGSRPSGKVNPRAVEFMKEVGYDLTAHGSKALDQFNGQEIDVAVTMGCGDACPMVRAGRREEWNIPDPKDMPPEQYREVRALIERKVKELLASL